MREKSKKSLRHGCLGNAIGTYCRKLKQILKRSVRKQMHKIPRIFIRIHEKSMKFTEKSFQKVSWGPKWPELSPRGAKTPPKGSQGVPKLPQGGPKGAPDGAKRGPREAK